MGEGVVEHAIAAITQALCRELEGAGGEQCAP